MKGGAVQGRSAPLQAEHLEPSTNPQADRYTKDTEMQGLNLWDAGQAT